MKISMKILAAAAAAAALVCGVAGCSSAPAPKALDGYLYYEGSSEKAGSAGDAAQISGAVTLDQQCWVFSGNDNAPPAFIAIPQGTITIKDADGELALYMPGGTTIHNGQKIDLAGSYNSRDPQDDQQLASLITACPGVSESEGGSWEIVTPNGYR